MKRYAEKEHMDRAAFLREILQKGFRAKVEEDILKQYTAGKISIGNFSERLKISVWDSFELLKQQNKNINVSLEDYIRASDLD
jgi:hypothetical protein